MNFRFKLARRLSVAQCSWLILAALVACSRGEKREFLGPPDPKPVDKTVASLIVVPHIGTMQKGEEMDFAAFGRTNTGDSVGAAVTWSASGGEVDGKGHFSAPDPGSYWIVARSVAQAEKADSANVLVVGPENPITRVTLSPKTLSIRIGQTRQFTAKAFFQDGAEAPVPMFWTTSGGSIDPNGVYTTPLIPGDYIVIAVVGNGLTDTATVHIGAVPVLTKMDLDPVADTLDEQASRQYAVQATWSDGSVGVPAVDFSATGGIIDSAGTYTADAPPGDYVIRVRERGGSGETNGRVWVRERTVTSLVLSPASIELSPGARQRFTAVGRLASGEVKTTSVNWQATGGSITTNGQYTAGTTAGTYRVIATQSGGTLADTSVVIISAPVATLTQLIVNPSAVTVAAGSQHEFSVAGSWSDGGSATPSVVWTATGGSVSADGVFTAGLTPGSFMVIAKHQTGTLADTSLVTVAGPAITGLTLTPASVTIVAGGSQLFGVAASWSDGSGGIPTLSWTPSGGTMSPAGLFTAGSAPGTYRLIVRDQGATVADTSFVTITSPAPVLQEVVVNPASIVLQPGDAQQFFAQGVWTNGGTATPQVTWTATGGAVTSGGRFTAGSTPGAYRVIAREPVSTKADTATVEIVARAPDLIGIQLLPEGQTIQAGGTQQFGVQGIWTNGGTGAPPVNYSATGGTIASSGLYTAGSTAGTYRVIATQQGGSLSDTVAVTVTSSPPQLTGIAVNPGAATVKTGASKQFTVTGLWTNGGSGAPAVAWTATGGTISSGGAFTAGSAPGQYRVVATQQGGPFADTAQVTVAAAAASLTSLTIHPGNITVQTGTKTELWVTGTWSDGSTTPPDVDWSATGGGTLASTGHFVAGGQPGTWKIIAKEQGGSLADTISVTVGTPYVTKVTLTPSSASISAGATQQFSVSATWSDGVSRAAAVAYSATGGTISVGGLYTAGPTAGVFAVIAACTCGKADTAVVTLNGPGGGQPPATLTQLSVNPGSATVFTGATQQFNVSATWSDGSSAAPSVTWSATGGSVSSSGLYTAPGSAGSYKVVAKHSGGTLADTADVTVQTNPGGQSGTAWFIEDFSSYNSTADLLKYPNSKWSGASEDVATNHIALDPAGAPVGGKSMRYDFPNRSGSPQLCHDYTIGRNIKFPSTEQEVWVEVWAKFSNGFETLVPSCTGQSSAGYKFLFARVPVGSRFNLIVGMNGSSNTFGYPDVEQAWEGKSPPHASQYFDGQWHRWRFHFKVGTQGVAGFAFDNQIAKVFTNVKIARSGIYGLSLGRNINQGPIQPQSLWWGQISVWRNNPGWGW